MTLASPARCGDLSPEEQHDWLQTGTRTVRSARTGQVMSISSAWLAQQWDDPEGHDVMLQVSRAGVPMLVVHGTADETVPVDAAHALAGAGGERARLCLIQAGNHVFGVPNPPDRAKEQSTAFLAMARAVEGFVGVCADNSLCKLAVRNREPMR
ncbi:MAG: hypothetical protein KJZ65_06915 [Phycisphaerales bacterium]|nr:hypothetical protein [Phycisphaerales bacterium]